MVADRDTAAANRLCTYRARGVKYYRARCSRTARGVFVPYRARCIRTVPRAVYSYRTARGVFVPRTVYSYRARCSRTARGVFVPRAVYSYRARCIRTVPRAVYSYRVPCIRTARGPDLRQLLKSGPLLRTRYNTDLGVEMEAAPCLVLQPQEDLPTSTVRVRNVKNQHSIFRKPSSCS